MGQCPILGDKSLDFIWFNKVEDFKCHAWSVRYTYFSQFLCFTKYLMKSQRGVLCLFLLLTLNNNKQSTPNCDFTHKWARPPAERLKCLMNQKVSSGEQYHQCHGFTWDQEQSLLQNASYLVITRSSDIIDHGQSHSFHKCLWVAWWNYSYLRLLLVIGIW